MQIVHARLDVSLRCGLSIRRHRSEVCSGGWQRKTSHVLRDAHAYMLISIPTATSTIFGAFQVMFSSFKVGGIDTCVFHHCMFAWRAHLSTRIRRRNCDQGSRPQRRLWRAAEPIGPRSNPSPSSTHLQVDSSFVERTTFGRTELLRRRTKFDWRSGVMRARRCSHELLPSAYTRATTLRALCSRWAKQRRVDISA